MPSRASEPTSGATTVDDRARTWSVALPAVPESLDPVQDMIAEMYDSVEDDLHATDRIRFESAVVEIVGNVIEHAQPRDGADSVHLGVEVSRVGRELRGIVSDDGRAADVDLSTSTMTGPDDVDGRGLAMALALSTELRYERVADRNRWTVRCDCT